MHHQPARMMRQRRQAPSAAASPSATAIVDSDSSVVNIPNVPTTTKALGVVIAILGAIIILGVGICLFRRHQRKAKKNSAPSHIIDFTSEKPRAFEHESKLDLHASVYPLEKPSPAFITGVSPADMNPGWVPQLAPNRGPKLPSDTASITSSKKSKGSKHSLRWDKSFSKFAPSERSPPPSYMPSSSSSTRDSYGDEKAASQIPLPPSPPRVSALPPTPPTPPAKKTKNPFPRELPLPKPAPVEIPPLPVPSPRSASFAAHQSVSLAQMATQMEDEAAPPRLMNVINPFLPSLDDELDVHVGETVRVLEEFQDGWCLVQRIGRIDAPQGVVPRSCLAERELIIPSSYSPKLRN